MALVKSDIGGNISVGFCHPFLSYVLLFFWVHMGHHMHACSFICNIAILMCFLFFRMTCFGYIVLPYLKCNLDVDPFFYFMCNWLLYTFSCFTFYTTFSMDYVPKPFILVQNFRCYMFSLYDAFFQSRDWNLSTPPIQPNSTTCTVWYKLRLKLKRLNHHPVVPMDFFGLQGKEHQATTI